MGSRKKLQGNENIILLNAKYKICVMLFKSCTEENLSKFLF